MSWMLFAQGTMSSPESIAHQVLRAEVLPFLVAAVAIIMWGLVASVRTVLQHRERVSMIRQGIDPDQSSASVK